MEIDIFEGCRGSGKSTITSHLRQKTSGTTLVNPTGFADNNQEGLYKISTYYNAWMAFLNSMADHDSKIIFDRFHFSERVFSILYKNYDFEMKYTEVTNALYELATKGVKINIFLFTVSNPAVLARRLNRDKIPFAHAIESANESIKQQEQYIEIMNELKKIYLPHSNFKIHTIDVSYQTIAEIYEEVLRLKAS